jgi:hypothetical protein
VSVASVRRAQCPIERVDVCAYRVPTEGGPESDGTASWDASTMVLVEIAGGGETGTGYTYADAATARVVREELSEPQVYRDRGDVPFDRYRLLLRAIPRRELLGLTKLPAGTIKMARKGRTLPRPENQRRLLGAIVSYFSDHALPAFETIEQLDAAGIKRDSK